MLIECKECGAQISSLAKACPKCGFPNKTKSKLATASLVLGIISIVYGLSYCANILFSQRTPDGILFPIVIMSILSIVFGSIALSKTRIIPKPLTGIILGAVTIIVCILVRLF